MILGIQRDLQSEGVAVSVSRLCHWFEVPRRTMYYKPTKAAPKVQDRWHPDFMRAKSDVYQLS